MVIDGPELMPSTGERSLGCSSDMEKSEPEVFGEWPDKDKEKEKDKEDDDWDEAKMKYKNMIRKARYETILICLKKSWKPSQKPILIGIWSMSLPMTMTFPRPWPTAASASPSSSLSSQR